MPVMIKTLERAFAEVATLPETDQEQIGRQLLSHVEKLRQLREELDKGVRSLDADQGEPLDIEDFLKRVGQDASTLALTDEQMADVERRLADPAPRFLSLEEVKERCARRRAPTAP